MALKNTIISQRINCVCRIVQSSVFSKRYFSSTTSCIEREFSNRITVRNDDTAQKSPIICLFGWGNGTKKHLLKYGNLFEEKGHTTVLVTTTLLNSLFRISTAGKKESENVKKALNEICNINKERQILFYSFSNGGCAISHLTMRSLIESGELVDNIKGHIFDSCPIVPNLESTVIVEKAFDRVINFPALKPAIRLFSKIMVRFVVFLNKDVQSFMSEMLDSPINTPQLFLFSKSDDLAPYQDILDFAEKRRQLKNVDVDYCLWDDSPHVAHFKQHEHEYREKVLGFLNKCIMNNEIM